MDVNDTVNIETVVGQVLIVRTEELMPDRNQPREYFDNDHLIELGQSMLTGGQFESIQVEEIDQADFNPKYPKAKYIIVGGENRWRAAIQSSIEYVRIEIRPKSKNPMDRHLAAIGLNGPRRKLGKMELARAIEKQLARSDRPMSVRDISRVAGITEVTTYAYLSLLKLPKELQDLVDPPTPPEKRIPFAVAVNLTRRFTEPDKMTAAWKNIRTLGTTAERTHAVLSLKGDIRRKRNRRKPSSDVRVILGLLAKIDSGLSRLGLMEDSVFKALKAQDVARNGGIKERLSGAISGLSELKKKLED